MLTLINLPVYSASLTPLKEPTLAEKAAYLGIDAIEENLAPVVEKVFGTLSRWVTVDLTSTPLSKEQFKRIQSAHILIACINRKCERKIGRSSLEDVDIDFNDIARKTSSNNGLAEIQAILEDTGGNNEYCVGPERFNAPDFTCKAEVQAPEKDGDIFVRDTSAAIYGLIYDGEGTGKLTIYDAEDEGTIYKTENETVPEPTSTLSLLALGTLGVVSTLKRKQNHKLTEKETTKVG